jgi:hypothetical protein
VPNVYKVLGQSAPAATTATTLYTVPAATATVLSTLTVCNQSATPTTFRTSIRPAGAVQTTAHYLFFDTPIPGNDTLTLVLGLSLAATDVITVYAGAATLSFHAYGCEIS